MLYYYVIYEDGENDTCVVKFDSTNLVTGFIEGKLENEPGYELGDFEVIRGVPLSIQVETKRIIRLGEQINHENTNNSQ